MTPCARRRRSWRVTRADAARACWDLGGREEAAKVAVAKAGGRKLAAADSGEKRHVVGVTDAQGADTAPAVGDRPGHLVEEVPQGVRSSTAARASS